MSIYDQCMLVRLHISMWGATATDTDLTRKVTDDVEAASGSLQVIKSLMPKTEMAPIRALHTLGRAEHKRMTVPSLVEGMRILTTKGYEKYTNSQVSIRDRYEEAVRDLGDRYDSIVDHTLRTQPKAYKASDFPSKTTVVESFSYSVHFSRIPAATDWRLDGLTEQDNEAIRESMQADFNAMVENAMTDVYGRVRTLMDNIKEQAEAFSDAPQGRLRDATFQNARELANIIPILNITGDEKLNAIAEDMREYFDYVEPKDVRASERSLTVLKDMVARIREKATN